MSTQLQEFLETEVLEALENKIVVFNDDVNTFDHVIDSFIQILNHTPEQAEQCATIIHFKGKCRVMNGDYEKLVPLCSAILDRGISAEIQ